MFMYIIHLDDFHVERRYGGAATRTPPHADPQALPVPGLKAAVLVVPVLAHLKHRLALLCRSDYSYI